MEIPSEGRQQFKRTRSRNTGKFRKENAAGESGENSTSLDAASSVHSSLKGISKTGDGDVGKSPRQHSGKPRQTYQILTTTAIPVRQTQISPGRFWVFILVAPAPDTCGWRRQKPKRTNG